MRFEGWRWTLLPVLAVGLLMGLSLSVVTVREHEAMRARQAQGATQMLAQQLSGRWPRLTEAELATLADAAFSAHADFGMLSIRDAQGQPRYERLRDEPLPEAGAWPVFIRAVAPLPRPLEAAIPGAVAPLNLQPPAVRIHLRTLAADAELHGQLNRIWLGVLVAWLLSAPALAFALVRIVRHQQPLVATARALAQGRHELRLPPMEGISEALAASLNRIGEHWQRLRTSPASGEETALVRKDLALERNRRQLLEQELNTSRELARQRGALIGSLAHELRTPLAALAGHIELLSTETPADSPRERLRPLHASTRQLMQLINDLLDWNRIENGQIALTRQSFDLADEVEETLRLLAPLAYEKGLELSQLVYHDVPPALTGDPARLRQILTNLLSNAIKYTERGEVVLRVMLEREVDGRILLALRVSDTGIGIAPDQLARLFLPYQRLQENAAGGTGLGLAITRHLVERMGGQISVESTPGQGAHFQATVWLETSPGTQRQTVTALRGLRIWAFDASASARLALRHQLEWWGAPTREFGALATLLAALPAAEPRPELLIIGAASADAADPVLRELTAHSGALPPVLLRVNAVTSPGRDQALSLGVSECLSKCAGSRDLARTLIRLCGRSHEQPAAPVLRGRRVLLAENSAATRAYLKALLESLGARVIETDNGRSAVQHCLSSAPDLALLDLHMPELDGIACTRQIRAQAPQRIPLIVISAHLEQEERDALKLAGTDAILQKPFDATQLQRACAPLLSAASADENDPARPSALDEMRELLREELPRQIEEAQKALEQGDHRQARESVHALHGTAAFYQLWGLRDACAKLEHLLAHDQAPDEETLRQLHQRAADALRSLS